MVKPIKPLLRIIEEGNSTFCVKCGSTMERRFKIFGLFKFGKVLYCHNKKCNSKVGVITW